MKNNELDQLDNMISQLIATCDRLQDENRQLKTKCNTLAAERSALLNRHDEVRNRLENMGHKLRTLEENI